MARFLIIETSSPVCSIAIAEDQQLLSLVEANEPKIHASSIIPFIEKALSEGEVTLQELSAIVVSSGPGSYTGLRIGVSTAKGLCYSLEKPLIAVGTLHGLAARALTNDELKEPTALLCPMIDARRMEVYAAIFDRSGELQRPVQADIVTESFYDSFLEQGPVYFFGDGMPKCKPLLEKHPNARFLEDVLPSAASLATQATDRFKKNAFEDVAYFEPFYLKDFVTTAKLKV